MGLEKSKQLVQISLTTSIQQKRWEIKQEQWQTLCKSCLNQRKYDFAKKILNSSLGNQWAQNYL